MWLFTSNSFLSIVEHQGDADLLLVRARLPGDIQRLFPEAAVSETPEHDYRYRATIRRAKVMNIIREQVAQIDYPNFKNSVNGPDRKEAYAGVWSEMVRAQNYAHSNYDIVLEGEEETSA